MKRTKALCAPLVAAFIPLQIFLLSACNVFLGPEPDTEPQAVLRSLWDDFNEIHAYIDIRMSYNQEFESWNDVYRYYNKILLDRIPEGSAGGDRDGKYLFDACGGMIGELKDPHVSLSAPGGNFFWTNANDVQKNEESWFNPAVIKKYLEDQIVTKSGYFSYGRFKQPDNDIGYIYIESFINNDKLEDQNWVWEIDGITNFLQGHGDDIKAIVIDIRNNSGGSGPAAEYIAARFTSVQKNYMKASAKNGPGRNDFSAPMTFRVRPEGTRFTKPIALLTNKATISAAEWFTMAMKTQRHITHVGTQTCGAFSPKTARPMINGWYYTISAFRVTDMNGTCFEGKGISPDPEYIFTGGLEEGTTSGDIRDTQLDKVLEIIRKW